MPDELNEVVTTGNRFIDLVFWWALWHTAGGCALIIIAAL